MVEDDGIGMNEETRARLLDVKRDSGEKCPCGCIEEDGECVEAKPESMSRRDAPTTADGSLKRGGGLALVNVLMRIHFFFGAESGIHVESQEGVGTRVTVDLIGEPHEPEGTALPSAR